MDEDDTGALDKKLIPPGVRIEIPLLPVSIYDLREIADVLAGLGQRLGALTRSGDTERHIKVDAWFLVREAQWKILRIKKHRLGDEDENSKTPAPLIRLKR